MLLAWQTQINNTKNQTYTVSNNTITFNSNIAITGNATIGNVLGNPLGNVNINGNLVINGNTNVVGNLVTSKLYCSNNGTGILGMQTGTHHATTNTTQTVTFPLAFNGGTNAPLVFLQVVYAGIGYSTNNAFIASTSLTDFTYNFSFISNPPEFSHAESFISIYWVAYQI